jgi:hypothetical protein
MTHPLTNPTHPLTNPTHLNHPLLDPFSKNPEGTMIFPPVPIEQAMTKILDNLHQTTAATLHQKNINQSFPFPEFNLIENGETPTVETTRITTPFGEMHMIAISGSCSMEPKIF